MFPMSVRILSLGLLLGIPFQAVADGGRLFGRGRTTVQCAQPVAVAAVPVAHVPNSLVALPQVSHHFQTFAQPVAAIPYAAQQPIVVQNNFAAPPPGLGTTVYGYAAQSAQTYGQLAPSPYAYQFQLDPAVVLAQSAEMARASNELAQSSVNTYERLSQRIIEQQTQTQQLLARAALIAATNPGIQQQQFSAAPSGGQSIRITPNPDGSFSISMENGQSPAPLQQPAVPQNNPTPSPLPDLPAEPSDQTGPIHPGINVLAQHCTACHTGATAKGGLQLFSQPGTYIIQDRQTMLAMWQAIEGGTMPPAGNAAGQPLPRLTIGEQAAVKDYLLSNN